MKYRDLIQFEPVTEVIQLKIADKKDKASQLINTYVISDRMADVILHRILPAIRLGKSENNRGLLIVGNYGTGKSHLMSVITSVAEHADLVGQVKNQPVRNGLAEIAGKFKVSRQETSALNVPLRDIVFTQLDQHLKEWAVDYQFPSSKEAITNKQALVDMMIAFGQRFPGVGLLVALDELLDFLRAKNEKEMIMDLNFLREVGEACEILPFRFMAGIQEALFDNSRFQFVADSIMRVKHRFDQASIVREDIAYVVSHRLLQKSDAQRKIIRKHLEQFTPLYSDMAERLDDFEELFPVHPAYLETFERVTTGERRELLKALSQEMGKLLDQDVPTEQPGLITYDSYWRMLSEDNAMRAIPEVRKVWDKSTVLSDKIKRAPETKDYVQAALQIIDGLALHRLTLSDIYAPIGITAAEIRDQLCIHVPLPEQDADFLLATVQTILKAISTAVNGQYISHNVQNDQYYLDLEKDIDYQALIDQKAEMMDRSSLDSYYFDILSAALEIKKESSYVPGFRIWESELSWPNHGITRQGYIFLGAANERSTAHPERDYYIHIHGIYGNGYADLQPRPDEVYFKLAQEEKSFIEPLRTFAGASEMSAISSGSNKDQYDAKARQLRKVLTQWLHDNFVRCFKVRHLQEEMTISEALAKYRVSLRDLPFQDQVFRLSGAVLAPAFAEKFPVYPRFEGLEITNATLASAAEAAIRAISGGTSIRLAQVVLEGLKLGRFEGGRMLWTIEQSPYAAYFGELVNRLEPGKVINRSDLLGGEPGAERDRRFNLEPELLLVVLSALVRQGILSISVLGAQVAENDFANGTRLSLDQLLRFTSINKPKPIPEQSVRELFEQFNVDPALVGDPHGFALGVTAFQQRVQGELNQVVTMLESLRDGPKFWQEAILPPEEQQKARAQLEDYRKFLNGLQPYATPARFANLTLGVGEIRAAVKARGRYDDLRRIFDILDELRPAWDYLVMAQPLLPPENDWQAQLADARKLVLNTLANPAKRAGNEVGGMLKARLENVRDEYIRRYLELHSQQRLDRAQDAAKQKLTGDPRWARMRALRKISLLPGRNLDTLSDSLKAVSTCFTLQAADMRNHAACPHCGFIPPKGNDEKSAAARLAQLEQDFDALCTSWVDTLLANLKTEEAGEHLRLVSENERQAVLAFLRARAMPEPLTQSFLDGVENTLQGLEVINIDGADYLLALTQPGMPCTPEDLEKRIREFLQQQLDGKDRRKVRIQINW